MSKKLSLLLLVILLAPGVASAGPITSLYVFGDSLSDSGNAFLLTGGFPPAPYAQRASNGPVAVERLAFDLGLTLAPAALGGTNYAVVGATTGPVQIPGSSPPAFTDNIATITHGQAALAGTGLLNQVGAFINTGPVANPDGSLFFVWAGANDFFIDPSLQGAANALTNIGTAIGALYADGARQFLIPNLPDLSVDTGRPGSVASGTDWTPSTLTGLQRRPREPAGRPVAAARHRHHRVRRVRIGLVDRRESRRVRVHQRFRAVPHRDSPRWRHGLPESQLVPVLGQRAPDCRWPPVAGKCFRRISSGARDLDAPRARHRAGWRGAQAPGVSRLVGIREVV